MSNTFTGRKKCLAIDAPIFFASLASNVLGLFVPLAMLMIFSKVIPHQSYPTLLILAIILLLVGIADFALKWARSVILGYAARISCAENYRILLEKTFAADRKEHSQKPTAVHMEKFNAIGRLRDHYAGETHALAIDLPFTLIMLAMVGLIGSWLILVPLFTILVIVVFASLMKGAQRKIFNKRKTLDSRRYAFLSEVLGKIKTVKANRMERQMTRRFELLNDQTVGSSHSLIMFSGFAQSFGAVYSQFSVAAMGLFGALFVIKGTIGIAELAACMLLNGRIVQPMMKLLTYLVQTESLTATWAKLKELESWQTQVQLKDGNCKLRGRVQADRVLVNHDDGLETRLSFKANPGEIVLFSAKDSSRFSSFVDILLGDRSNASGRLLIDGYLASDRRTQRGTGGIIALEDVPAIFGGTLLDNLCGFGDGEQSRTAKCVAAELGLQKRIHKLPMGYDTILGQGSQFEKSSSNRLLIALTRAFSLAPKILILNEPSSALENVERDLLSHFIANLKERPTILVYSPDPRFARIADQIVDLDQPNNFDETSWCVHDKSRQDVLLSQKGVAA